MTTTATFDDLLKALKNPNKITSNELENTKETWKRIGQKDKFEELGLNSSELEAFLKEFTENNPYENIK